MYLGVNIMEVLKLQASNILDLETQMHYSFIHNVSSTECRHCHDFYEIFLITQGSIIHYVNEKHQLLAAGSMVFIRPEDIHYYGSHNRNECQFINIAFSCSTLKELINYLGDPLQNERFLSADEPSHVVLAESDKSASIRKLEQLALIPRTDKNQIRTYLRLILADFIFNYFLRDNGSLESVPLWLEQLVTEMKKRENFREGLKQLMKLSDKSSEYLSRMFKKHYKKTPTDFINELRLNYAANMLIHSDTSILDIALDAGFNNLSHFYHLFNKQFHESPLRFRKFNQRMLIN
jgi:AraC family transcriptional regulator, dual regulator of chb operon